MLLKPFSILIVLLIIQANNCFANSENNCIDTLEKNSFNYTNETQFVDITIEIYENTAKIVIPKDVNIRIQRRLSIPVRIYLDYQAPFTNLGDFRLAIRSPGTSLVPVKIPPPPSGFKGANDSRNAFYWRTEHIDGTRLTAGNHNMGFRLEKCDVQYECYSENNLPEEQLIHSNSTTFSVYNLLDLSVDSIYWIPENNRDGFMLKYIISNRYPDPILQSSKIKFYASNDQQINNNDVLLTTKTIGSLGALSYKTVDLFMKPEIQEKLIDKYIICQLDTDDDIDEINEDNNQRSYLIKSYRDLEIKNVEIYWPRNKTKIHIICTITNTGELNVFDTTATNLYHNSSFTLPQLLDNQQLQPVGSNQKKQLIFYIHAEYYFKHLIGQTLSIKADVGNRFLEINENNNHIKFDIPRIQLGDTVQVFSNRNETLNKSIRAMYQLEGSEKVAPNPFTDAVTFTFPSMPEKSEVLLTLYDIKGTIVDQKKSKTFSVKGGQAVTYTNQSLLEGLYFYKIQTTHASLQGFIVKK